MFWSAGQNCLSISQFTQACYTMDHVLFLLSITLSIQILTVLSRAYTYHVGKGNSRLAFGFRFPVMTKFEHFACAGRFWGLATLLLLATPTFYPMRPFWGKADHLHPIPILIMRGTSAVIYIKQAINLEFNYLYICQDESAVKRATLCRH